MHVTIISYTLEFGGVELHIARLVEYLREHGNTVTILVMLADVFSDRIESWKHDEFGVELRRVARPSTFGEARRIFRTLPRDACVFEKGWFDAGSIGLDLAARLWFNRYITVEQLEAEPVPPRFSRRYLGGAVSGLGLWWYRLKLRGWMRTLFPMRIVCVSRAVATRLQTEFAASGKKLCVASNGIQPARFARQHDSRRRLRDAWGLGDEGIVFGAVARFHKVKALDVAIRQYSQLQDDPAWSNSRLVLVGEGSEEAALRKVTAATGIDANVVFLPFTNDPAALMSAFDFFVMPSRNEGLPFALLEAMACECVPIAADVGGIREVLDQEAGYLVPANDENRFGQTMRSAMHLTKIQRGLMGERARQRVVAEYDGSKQIAQIVEILKGNQVETDDSKSRIAPFRRRGEISAGNV